MMERGTYREVSALQRSLNANRTPEAKCTTTEGGPTSHLDRPVTGHTEDAEAVIAALRSDMERGLDQVDVRRRLERYGPNQLRSAPEVPWWRRLLEQFENLLVIILLVATVISAVEWLLQDPRETALPYEAIVILVIVVLNALLGFMHEMQAEKSVRALMALAAPEATVVRNGERQRVATDAIVPGDILLVEAGDKIPADARLIEGANLYTDEAPLTGESLPVSKNTSPVEGDAGIGDRRNILFSGTVATAGRGRAVVIATGMQTEVGRIAGLLESAKQEPTPLQQELDRTGRRLTVIMLGICGVVFVTGLFSNTVTNLDAILGMFLFAVALAVAAIPEALPAIVTVGLSLGVRRMAASNAIVRKLPAVETLGATTVICSDKTGTLTKNEMTVRSILTASGRVEISGSGYIPEGTFTVEGAVLAKTSRERGIVEQILRTAALANDATLVHSEGHWRVQGDPTEGALIVAARKFGILETDLAQWPRAAEISFTSERKRHTTVHIDRDDPHKLQVFVKGAPEIVLGKCRYLLQPDRIVPLSDEDRANFVRRNEELAAQALRTLAVASRSIPAVALEPDSRARGGAELSESIEDDLVLLGIIGMMDPPRPEVKAAVATAKRAHVRTVMITGDHPATAEAIARELEISELGARLMKGSELRAMSEAELEAAVEEVRVFARVDPEHKLRIVAALQRKGHIVAMTGDGINDAPALKTANIGIAMGITGTDVSKEAADMVLTDDNFASIVKAIEEGRGIFDNIRKYLIYLLSSNAGELLTMFVGVMFAGMLGLVPAEPGLFLPLLAAQLLWINLITDGPPALALGIDPKDPNVMERWPRRHGAGVLTAGDWMRVACVGAVMMVGTIAVLDAYYPGGLFTLFAGGAEPNRADEAHARTMAFTTLMMFQIYNVYASRSSLRSAFAGFFENKWLLAAVALSLIAHALVIYLPVLQSAFRTVQLSVSDWSIAAGVGSILLLVTEVAKAASRRGGQNALSSSGSVNGWPTAHG